MRTNCKFCGIASLDGEPCCTDEFKRDVVMRADVVFQMPAVDAGPLAKLQLEAMHRLLAPVLEAAAFAPGQEKAEDAIKRLLGQWRSGIEPRVLSVAEADNAELRARVEELERQRPAANRAEHCTVEREDGRICGGSIEVDEDGDIACEFCRSRAHIAKLAAACSAKDEALAEIRPEVRMFAVQMEAKLKANDHKPGWKDDDLYDLKLRCDEELAELGTAIRHDAHPDVIVSEAADVANFAMMIADNAQRALLRARGGA